jgi:hypothetical protein
VQSYGNEQALSGLQLQPKWTCIVLPVHTSHQLARELHPNADGFSRRSHRHHSRTHILQLSCTALPPDRMRAHVWKGLTLTAWGDDSIPFRRQQARHPPLSGQVGGYVSTRPPTNCCTDLTCMYCLASGHES